MLVIASLSACCAVPGINIRSQKLQKYCTIAREEAHTPKRCPSCTKRRAPKALSESTSCSPSAAVEAGVGVENEPLDEDAERDSRGDVSGALSDSPFDSRFRQQGRRRRMRLELPVVSEIYGSSIGLMQNVVFGQSNSKHFRG